MATGIRDGPPEKSWTVAATVDMVGFNIHPTWLDCSALNTAIGIRGTADTAHAASQRTIVPSAITLSEARALTWRRECPTRSGRFLLLAATKLTPCPAARRRANRLSIPVTASATEYSAHDGQR